MPKKYTRHRTRKTKKSKKTRKTKIIRKNKIMKGGQEQVKCSICEKTVDKNNTLVPSSCSLKHGLAAHRICQYCWWDPNKGFALEGTSHECPGCQKGLPLTAFKKNEPISIDLTDD